MTNRNKRLSRGVAPSAGERLHLNHLTPRGLFESDDGDRYIVSEDDERGPLAIVFRHRLVPVFTWHALTPHMVTTGRWWGPYRVRLTSSVGWEEDVQQPGTVFLMGDTIGIDCHYSIEGGSAIPFGSLLGDTGQQRDAEAWSIEAIEAPFRFCARSRRGGLRYGATPLEMAEAGDRKFVVELDPRSALE